MHSPARYFAVAALILSAMSGMAVAQSLDDSTVESIVGSGVKEEEATAAAERAEVLAAIDGSAEAVSLVRKAASLDSVDIVFLSDTARTEGGPPPDIAAKTKQHEAEIALLRQEVEANAMLYHAINSRGVLVADILAVTFDGPKKVIIYAMAKPSR